MILHSMGGVCLGALAWVTITFLWCLKIGSGIKDCIMLSSNGIIKSSHVTFSSSLRSSLATYPSLFLMP